MSRCLPRHAQGFPSYPKGQGQWSGLINHVCQEVPSVCTAESELEGSKTGPRRQVEGRCRGTRQGTAPAKLVAMETEAGLDPRNPGGRSHRTQCFIKLMKLGQKRVSAYLSP